MNLIDIIRDNKTPLISKLIMNLIKLLRDKRTIFIKNGPFKILTFLSNQASQGLHK